MVLSSTISNMYRVLLTSTSAAMKKHVKIVFVRFTQIYQKIETSLNEYSLLPSLTYFDDCTRECASKRVKEQVRTTAR